MEKLHFYNTENIYEGKSDFLKKNIIVINFVNNVPTADEIKNGFEILNENNGIVQAEYPEFNTVYRTYADDPYKMEISNDGSVYTEPEPTPIPVPYIPDLEDVKAAKIEELSTACSQAITNGAEVEIDGITEHFSYKEEDQVNIKEIFDLAVTTGVPMYYHADGKGCKLYTVDQIIAIYSSVTTNKMHHQTYFNQLKLTIEKLETIEDVEAIEYGAELTGEALETYNAAMAQAQTLLIALLASKAE